MATFRPPGSPAKRKPAKVRVFDGIGGPPLQVLKRTNYRGWDISNSICNDVRDLDLSERGTAKLRPGMQKMATTGQTASIVNVFQSAVGGRRSYGVISGGTLTMTEFTTL